MGDYNANQMDFICFNKDTMIHNFPTKRHCGWQWLEPFILTKSVLRVWNWFSWSKRTN